MAAFVVSPVSVLMISCRVSRWIDAASPEIRRTFEGALDFAEALLGDAIDQLRAFSSMVVLYENALLVIRFDAATERFCVVAFFVDESDPLPPDGPFTGVGRPTLAYQLMARLGLSAAVIIPHDSDDYAPMGGRTNPAERTRLTTDSSGAGLRLSDQVSSSLFERDLPKSRSKSFGTSLLADPNFSCSARANLHFARLKRLRVGPGVQTPDTPPSS